MDESEIVAGIKSKGVRLPCHRCKGNKFSIVNDTSKLYLYKNVDDSISTHSIPIIVTICKKCGVVSEYALMHLFKGAELKQFFKDEI